MRAFLRLSALLAAAGPAFAQFPGLTLPPSGGNQKAAVTQYIGPVRVSIEYSSPAVHGPDGKDRRGQIWGKLVAYGLTDLGFGPRQPAPWRAGANENTVFEVSHAVQAQGKTLPAGRYGLHMIAGPEEWTLIFSRANAAWGSFFYDEKDDALRVAARPRRHEYREWLTYEFTERKSARAVVEMQWEDLAVPWTIEVKNPEEIYVSRLREELTSSTGFSFQAYASAAQYCLTANTHLEDGLKWADAAIAAPFIGQPTFFTLSTKAQILARMGREAEAKEWLAKALRHPTATPPQIHQAGRVLLAEKKYAEAMEVFKLNAERNGDAWPVNVGLARGYSAMGELAKALEHAKLALAQAPDPLNKRSLEQMVETLAAGKAIAQ
jgi:tetratricopeptide (TPR) repeat protein